MSTYIYPTNQELKAVEQDKVHAPSMNDPIFKHFPMVNVDSHVLSWEQRDNYKGLNILPHQGLVIIRANVINNGMDEISIDKHPRDFQLE